MTTKHYLVTGAPTIGLEVPVRKEFNEFVKDVDVLNLYLLALERIQNIKQEALISHFQIAGIHGKPYIPWDNVQGLADPDFGGYCTHGSVIFPTWHRPYVALYEQVVWNEAMSIANSYHNTDLRDKYQAAARRLRQPYWDWAANATLHPLLNTVQTITVVDVPDGKSKQIENPLLKYTFHPLDPSFTERFSIWKQTVRHPTSETDANAQSQPGDVQNAMNVIADQLHDNIFYLLSSINDWATMSNHASSHTNSLEAIHDTVHLAVGGTGHMGDIPMAGFDPIFFIHHANVDRMLSLWQALNPTLWVVPGSSGEGSLTVPPKETIDTNTDLTPFHLDNETFWNSTTSRDTRSFGYTYPEVCDASISPEELKCRVERAVMKLYGPHFRDAGATDSTGAASESVKATSFAGNPANNPGSGESGHEVHSKESPEYPARYHDWYVTITINPSHFARSGYVHVFLCETVPEGNWLFAPERVGDAPVFRNTSGECANCNRKEAAGETIGGRVPLTTALLKRGKDINDVEHVKEYLGTHLHWRCALVDGTVIPLEDAPSLQVKLYSALSERGEGFPKRHAPNVHRSVTHGKLGGYFEDTD